MLCDLILYNIPEMTKLDDGKQRDGKQIRLARCGRDGGCGYERVAGGSPVVLRSSVLTVVLTGIYTCDERHTDTHMSV